MITSQSAITALGPFDQHLIRCLEVENIRTVGDLISLSETDLRRSPQFGYKGVTALKEALAREGLQLKPCNWGK